MERKPNYFERIRMVRAMEEVCRNLNDEDVFYDWLCNGVADGDIDANTKDEDLMYYVEDDERFADLMDTFAWIMHKACPKDYKGAFYCDWVCSHPDKDEEENDVTHQI